MFSFRSSCRTLTCAIVCFLIAATAFTVRAQAPAGNATSLTAIAPAAQNELNKGVDALKNDHYEEATAHFQRAVELDPDSILAKVYLGFALSENVVPGVNSPDNLKAAQQAIDIYKQVLEKAPHLAYSMEQIAGIYFEIGKFDDGKTWQKKALEEDPQDAEAAYTIGVIDWREAYENALAALRQAGMNDDGRGNTRAPAAVMRAIKAQNGPLVDEGLKYLAQAVQLRPYYDDAMQYLSLMYRRKADLDRGDEAALQEDLSSANAWMQKAIEARKYRETHEVNDSRGASSGNPEFDLLAPPTPPTPPPPPPPPPPLPPPPPPVN